ncbi:MAG: M23 family metallopeptidase [Campylobacteraceae bacterium]|jgi:murein DD-endopeptidase MepM/ murein hydrolase activator NlpD|nr:M23 family metallopeptidase [Campylobacteraceae bacterium]
MRDKFTITISDVRGSRHYTLNQIIKKIIFYILISVLFLIVSGAIYIAFLNNEVKVLADKKDELQKGLDENIAYYEAIQSKIKDIEEIIGIAPEDENASYDTRLENINLTTIQQSILLQLLPNGGVIDHKGISAGFGTRDHPIYERTEFHRGIDFRAPLKTPVFAPAAGIVEFAGMQDSSGYGSLVIIDHGFGFKTYYAHLDSKMILKYGKFVKKGEHIANSGNTGLSTGPHLHYEIRFLGRPLNPINFINWNNNNFSEIFEKEKGVQWESLLEMASILLANKQNQQ